jgi:hypothetical protein
MSLVDGPQYTDSRHLLPRVKRAEHWLARPVKSKGAGGAAS